MKIKRTANLGAIECWLMGGYIDSDTYNDDNLWPGFHDFWKQDENEDLLTGNKYDIEKVKDKIKYMIEELGSTPEFEDKSYFPYFGEKYRFKVPNEKNLNRLANAITQQLQNELEE